MVCTTLGLHGPNFFPKKTGKEFELPPYLKHLKKQREKVTVFSGLSHPDQAGANGHSSEMTWLTGAINPGLGGFRNTISLDQYVAEKFGYATRFPSLNLSTNGTGSQSYTRSGVMVPAEHKPSELFAKLFLQGKPQDVQRQRQKLDDGKSILDSLMDQTKKLQKNVDAADRQRLEEYFESIRTAENRLTKANQWLQKPKPKVDSKPPRDIDDGTDLIGRMQLLMEMVPLIVQTDSTRMITIVVHGRGDVPKVPGVSIGHHNLSHHGQDETKIEQLAKIENGLMKSFATMLSGLDSKKEPGGSLLDNTMVLFGSNLGNANAHDWRNLPILLAGGKFNHGQHVGFEKDNNKPLSNLYLTMLQRLGIETDQFATSTGTLAW